MLEMYLKNLYARTMREAYSLAHSEIAQQLSNGEGDYLDCGANTGHYYDTLFQMIALDKSRYHGIEWHADAVKHARKNGLNVIQGDLNKKMDFADQSFRCISGFSVLEHILNPCHYLKECFRCLEAGGTLVILTPNISTFFTIMLLLVGKMPSSGPHPDSDILLNKESFFKQYVPSDVESETPIHRHLIVFSYRVLNRYLQMIGFDEVKGYGFGLYPFPNFMQPICEKIDPYHCHQMVFIARKF